MPFLDSIVDTVFQLLQSYGFLVFGNSMCNFPVFCKLVSMREMEVCQTADIKHMSINFE